MAEDRRPKQTAFRLPQRTLDILDDMVNNGKARTRTDALIQVVDATKKPVSTDDAFFVDKMKEYESRISRLEEEKEEIEEMKKTLSDYMEKKQNREKEENK